MSCRQLLRERAGEKEASSREEGARGQEGSPPAPGDPPRPARAPFSPRGGGGEPGPGAAGTVELGPIPPVVETRSCRGPPAPKAELVPERGRRRVGAGKVTGRAPAGDPAPGRGHESEPLPRGRRRGQGRQGSDGSSRSPAAGKPGGQQRSPAGHPRQEPPAESRGGRPREGSGRHRAAPEEPRGDGTPAYSGHPRPGETRRRHRERPWRASSPQARSPGSRRRVRGPAGPPLARDPGTGTPGSAGPGPGPAAAAAAALPPPVPRRRRPLAAAGGGDAVGRSTAEGHRWEWDRQGILRWEGELRDLKKICSCQGATASWEAGQASADPLETRDTVHGA